MQRGYIFQRHGAWHLRYWIGSKKAGNLKQECRKLVEVCDEYRTKRSVVPLADKILRPLNETNPLDIIQTLAQFIESKYLPHVETFRRPSTYRGYKNLYHRYIAKRAAGIRLASFRTATGQALLNEIATQRLSQLTMTNVKSFLSGIFSFAKKMGEFEGHNPMQGTEVKGQASDPTYAYSLDEVKRITKRLKGTAPTVVIVAAWTGLSLGELQGLKWTDISDEEINVRRTIWQGREGLPKTAVRGDSVPLLDEVRTALAEHHKKNPGTTWVFENPANGKPHDLAALGNKKIKIALKGTDSEWHGYHAFRRSFATRLHEAGVKDKTIQSLLRHSSLKVTMGFYVKSTDSAKIEAMEQLAAVEKRKRNRR